jgi:uncharacterized protein
LPDHEVADAIVQVLREDAAGRSGFHRLYAAPDDPITIEEAMALFLVILGPSTPHVGKGVAKSAATDVVVDTLMRYRASQRRFRNTLIFVAADEVSLSTAQEAMRRALAWASIAGDARLQSQLTQAQGADTKDKAKTSQDGAQKAVRNAWSHILFPIKTENTEAGKAFELDHLSVTSKDRAPIPTGVYDKARSDGLIKEKLGPDALWLHLKPLWPDDKPHLAIAEVADWFACYLIRQPELSICMNEKKANFILPSINLPGQYDTSLYLDDVRAIKTWSSLANELCRKCKPIETKEDVFALGILPYGERYV